MGASPPTIISLTKYLAERENTRREGRREAGGPLTSARDTYDAGRFHAAYDKVIMARWPTRPESVTVPTPFGVTHVHVTGPADGPPLVLLPGGGAATSAFLVRPGR